MCGVPVERADDYLNRLIALGHRVAVCEQMEDPAAAKKRGPKSVVKRDVVRLVTPGTITEERLLEPGRARLLVAVQKVRSSEGRQGLRARGARPVDGCGRAQRGGRSRPRRGDCAPRAERGRRIASGVRRTACFPRSSARCAFPRRRSRATAATARRLSAGSASSTASKPSTASARSRRAEIAAAALALAYVKRTQFEARPALSPPTRRARGTSLEIDPATRANLELTRTLSGARDGSLLATIDLTVTPAGRSPARRAARESADRSGCDQPAARFDRFPGRGGADARRLAPGARACARFSAGLFAA